jgi:hypothetical protein
MLNLFCLFLFLFVAVYQYQIKHSEAGFVHWMLWAIVCGIAFIIQDRLHERNKR